MRCPRCSGETTTMENKGLSLDVCYDGCGGIWFDWLELKKIDQSHEADPEFLKKLGKSKTRSIDLSSRLKCPKCHDMIMMRRFSSVKRKVEMDECPKCGGMWLDAGELTHIHNEFKSEEEAKQATEKYIAEVFAPAAQMEQDTSSTQALEKTAMALRAFMPGRRLGRFR